MRHDGDALYGTLFELSPGGVVLLDPLGVIRAFNDQACRQLGYTREEFSRLRVSDFDVDEHASELVRDHLDRIAAAGREQFATRHRMRDGAIRDVLVSSRPVDLDGERLFLAVWQDVTDQFAAAEALRQSEERFRAFVLATSDVVYRMSPDWSEMRQLVGRGFIPDTDVPTSDWMGTYIHPDDQAAVRVVIDAAIRSNGIFELEHRVLREDGTLGWTFSRAIPMLRPDGSIAEWFGAARDVTSLVEAREAQARAELRFRALIEKSSDLIMVLDAEGRYAFWSQGATQALGWSPEERLGHPGPELMHPDDQDRIGATLENILATPGAVSRDVFRYRHKDGSWREIDAVARNLLDDPAVQGVVVNGRDVTGQRLLEEELRQAQKLESLGRLAGGVAHDFNNLLTVILACGGALREDLVGGPPERVEEIDEILAAGERARDLTRQLLAFARKHVMAPVYLDLNVVIGNARKILERLLDEDIELRIRLSPTPCPLHADPIQVEQVLLNLAANARDAMPRGGILTLETVDAPVRPETVEAEPDRIQGHWSRLVVRDTGTGMTPEVQAHMFEPFYTTKETGKGSGLGMASVYGIVHQSGGHVHVKSEPGKGTTIEVCFPRAKIVESSPTPGPDAAPRGGGEMVLVVEDNPQVQVVTIRALRRAGYAVVAASRPDHALELPRETLESVQLLVTDVVMPGMDGPTLASELRRRHPGLRVLFASGYSEDAVAERGVLKPDLDFLEKPFAGDDLLKKVREILDRPEARA